MISNTSHSELNSVLYRNEIGKNKLLSGKPICVILKKDKYSSLRNQTNSKKENRARLFKTKLIKNNEVVT